MMRAMMGKKSRKLLEIKHSRYDGPMIGDTITFPNSITLNGITYSIGDDVVQFVLHVYNFYGVRSGVCLNNTGLDDYYGYVSTDSTTDTPPFIQDLVFDPNSRTGEWEVTIKVLSDFKIYSRQGKNHNFINLIGVFKVVGIVQIN